VSRDDESVSADILLIQATIYVGACRRENVDMYIGDGRFPSQQKSRLPRRFGQKGGPLIRAQSLFLAMPRNRYSIGQQMLF
jgi:hypothetical protein